MAFKNTRSGHGCSWVIFRIDFSFLFSVIKNNFPRGSFYQSNKWRVFSIKNVLFLKFSHGYQHSFWLRLIWLINLVIFEFLDKRLVVVEVGLGVRIGDKESWNFLWIYSGKSILSNNKLHFHEKNRSIIKFTFRCHSTRWHTQNHWKIVELFNCDFYHRLFKISYACLSKITRTNISLSSGKHEKFVSK